jgi:phosphate transport system substrate-binding protein
LSTPFLGILAKAAAGLLALALSLSTGHAEQKLALVIGNDQYDHVPRLERAVNDAEAVGAAFEHLGFTVTLAKNVGFAGFAQTVAAFEAKIQPGDLVALHYSGHGVAIGGRNYLVPVDMIAPEPGQESLVARLAVDAGALIDEMRERNPKLVFAILDACRDNPFAASGRSIGKTRGLARMEPEAGEFILFSAGPGEEALDRLGSDDHDKTSVFTRVLLAHIETPGLTLQDLAKATQGEVRDLAAKVNHDQFPDYFDRTIDKPVLNDRQIQVEAPAPPSPAVPANPVVQPSAEIVFWDSIKDSRSKADFDAYLEKFPDGTFAPLARARLAALQAATPEAPQHEPAVQTDEAVWQRIARSSDPVDFESFVRMFPDSAHRAEAEAKVSTLRTAKLEPAAPESPATISSITGAGATSPYPIYAKWADAYHAKTGVSLNYLPVGSGGGIKQIEAKTVTFGASDVPLKPDVLDQFGLLQFPTVMGAIVPIINLPRMKPGEIVLDGPTLANIYLGKITRWDDPELRNLNPKVRLPSAAISVVHRSDASGTTFNFAYYLAAVNAEWRDKTGVNTSVDWPAGLGANGNKGVADLVEQTPFSIGYVEYAYAVEERLTFTAMVNRDARIVEPAANTLAAAAANADWEGVPGNGAILANQPGAESWPMTTATFIIVSKQPTDVAAAREVLKFFDWAYANGDVMALDLSYVPMPKAVVDGIEKRWASEIAGPDGSPIFAGG